jgi:hypothetical protein
MVLKSKISANNPLIEKSVPYQNMSYGVYFLASHDKRNSIERQPIVQYIIS